MKLRNKFLFYIGLSTVVSLTSCGDFADGMLTQQNPAEMNTNIFWKNLEDCESALAAVYNAFKNSDNYIIIEETKRTDLAWPGTGGTNKFPSSTDEYYLQIFNSSSSAIEKKWSALYKGIFYANQVLAGLDKLDNEMVNDADYDLQKSQLIRAQARFFRGLFYFYLSTSFNNGAVPIFDFVPQTVDEFYLPCNTAENVKEFYREDLEYAEKFLPKKGTSSDWKDGDLGRPRSETASAVLGTSYLYDANKEDPKSYDIPKEYFKKIIDNETYSLAGPGDNAYTDNELNDESLLEVIYTYDFKNEYPAGSVESLSTLINRNISNVGGWTSIYPAFWLTYSFLAEPVDRLNPVNKIQMERDLHGDLYYGYDPKNAQKIVQLGGENYLIYPVIARCKDIEDHINGAYSKKDILSSTTITDADKQKMSMAWSDSVYVFLKKLKVNEKGEIIARTRDEMTGNEGYEFVNSNKDMMPCRPMWYDRNVGTIPIFDNDNIGEASIKDQMYSYDTPVDQGSPYRYRQRSLRCKYSLWTYYDMDNGAYLYMFPGDHGKFQTYSVFKKYTNWQTRKSEDEIPKADSDINFRLIRLADIYLMYAECLIKGGKDDNGVVEASKYINRVRKRAGTVLIGREAYGEYQGQATYQDTHRPDHNIFKGDYYDLYKEKDIKNPSNPRSTAVTEDDIIDTAEEIMNHLMYKERPLELCLDGHAIRSCDLRRWGVTKDRFTYLSTEYPFTTTGIHIFNWETCYDSKKKIIDWNKQAKNWVYRFKYLPDNEAFKTYRWAKNETQANTGALYEFKEPAANYNETKAYYPLPNTELTSNPYIKDIVDRNTSK